MKPFKDFSDPFDFNEHAKLTLTDKNASKRLLGFKFNRSAGNNSHEEKLG